MAGETTTTIEGRTTRRSWRGWLALALTGRRWALVAAAVLLQGIYAGFFVRQYGLLPYYARPLLDLGKIGGYGPDQLMATGTALGLMVVAHALAWWGARRLTAAAVGPALAVSLLFQATLLWMYPIVAADIFNYALQGRLLTEHGLNPMTTMPSQAPGDPWLPYSAWRDIVLPYGPLWVGISVGVAALAGDSLLAALLGFKLVALLANLLNAWLVWRIAARLRPEAALPALIFYAWSPLVLFETVGNGHNDGLLATPLLLMLWVVARGGAWATLSQPALALAVLVKYWPVIHAPAALLATWQTTGRRWWAVALGMALGAAVVVAGFAPFWEGPRTLEAVRREASGTTTSFVALIVLFGAPLFDKDTWLRLLRPAIAFGLLLLVLWRRPRQPADLPASLVDVTLAYLLVATFWFQPWYLVPLVALAAASADRWRQSVAIAYSATAHASYLVYFYLWVTPWWGALSVEGVQTLAVAVTHLPVLALLLLRAGWLGATRQSAARSG